MARPVSRKIKMYIRIYTIYNTLMAYKLQKLLGNVIYSLHWVLFFYLSIFIRLFMERVLKIKVRFFFFLYLGLFFAICFSVVILGRLDPNR